MKGFEPDGILDPFAPVGLNEMDSVRLMNRIDKKYIFSAARLPFLLSRLYNSYSVLEIDNIRSFSYATTYFDTYDYLFFKHQVTGKLERNKVRHRLYENTGTAFLEVKKRTNTNRTIKWRIKAEKMPAHKIEGCPGEFVNRLIPVKSDQLIPVLLNNFNRITLVNAVFTERVTIDYNVSFTDTDTDTDSGKAEFPYLAIVEIKKASHSGRSEAEKVLREMSVRPTGFSKYCIGTAVMKDMPRKNILKQKLLMINKIKIEYDRSLNK
jgi:hypothetical protein